MHQGARPQSTLTPTPDNNMSRENTEMSNHSPHKSKTTGGGKLNFLSSGLIICIGILLAVIVFALVFYKTTTENNYIDTSTYQSVFVNVNGSSGGQAYFGHIVSLNSSYLVLNDVFYLQSGSTTNQFTLNNLSCALYNPDDQMVINRSQVAFWENLKSNSQVVTDINKWNSENLQCSKATSAATSSSSTSSTGSSTTSPTTTTPSTSSKTTTTK